MKCFKTRHKMASQSTENKLREWVIQNMIDIEANNLDERKRKLFLDLLLERKDDEFIQECYVEFERRKEEKKNKKSR